MFGKQQPQWRQENHPDGTMTFLPDHLRGNLVDITTVAQRFRQYLDLNTGAVHDSETYYNRYKEILEKTYGN